MSDFWDEKLTEKNAGCSKYSEYYRYRIRNMNRLMSEWMDRPKCSTILKTDLWNEAVGHDDALSFFRNRGNTLLGVDISKKVTDVATANFEKFGEKFRFFQSTIQTTPFKDNSIDIIFSLSTLDHLTPEENVKALIEIRRVMKQNGHAIVTVDNVTYLFMRALIFRLAKKMGMLGVFGREKKEEILQSYFPYTLAEFKSFISRAHLKLIHWSAVSLLPNFTHGVYVVRNRTLIGTIDLIERHKMFDMLKYELVFHLRKWERSN
jgi:ubiquinone/menaquinone biosynthesis C-methylase UbiE